MHGLMQQTQLGLSQNAVRHNMMVEEIRISLYLKIYKSKIE